LKVYHWLVKEVEEQEVAQEEVELEEIIDLTKWLELPIKVILSGMELHMFQVDMLVLREAFGTVAAAEVRENKAQRTAGPKAETEDKSILQAR